MPIAYLDCPTGVAGDMMLGAIVDAGVPLTYLVEQLEKLGIKGEFRLRQEPLHHNGQLACKVHVDLLTEHGHHDHSHSHEHSHEHSHREHGHSHEHGHDHHHPSHDHTHTRCLPEIEDMMRSAGLPQRAENWSLAVFRQLAVAEGAVHGIAPEAVWFHEVGAIDAIVDIVGTCLGLDWLGIDELHCAALPTGGGTVWAAHGRLPVPVPAVLKLWEMRQVPVFYNGIDRELVTPTGAAIVTTLAKSFGQQPPMVIQKVGLGAGTLSLPMPNMVRLWVGQSPSHTHPQVAQSVPDLQDLGGTINSPKTRSPKTITVLETQIDDLNPQAIGYLFDRLFATGAVDVFTQPIGMKKSRPGILLTVICPSSQVDVCEQVIFAETTTLGIRRSEQHRTELDREFQHVHTAYGNVHIKVAKLGDRIVNAQPEYEDCATIAAAHNLPWREVHQLALSLWHSHHHHHST
jgi:pyridinium-3,5-bisthiocarboxylic acid mononucleotide nickel chelatase